MKNIISALISQLVISITAYAVINSYGVIGTAIVAGAVLAFAITEFVFARKHSKVTTSEAISTAVAAVLIYMIPITLLGFYIDKRYRRSCTGSKFVDIVHLSAISNVLTLKFRRNLEEIHKILDKMDSDLTEMSNKIEDLRQGLAELEEKLDPTEEAEPDLDDFKVDDDSAAEAEKE